MGRKNGMLQQDNLDIAALMFPWDVLVTMKSLMAFFRRWSQNMTMKSVGLAFRIFRMLLRGKRCLISFESTVLVNTEP